MEDFINKIIDFGSLGFLCAIVGGLIAIFIPLYLSILDRFPQGDIPIYRKVIIRQNSIKILLITLLGDLFLLLLLYTSSFIPYNWIISVVFYVIFLTCLAASFGFMLSFIEFLREVYSDEKVSDRLVLDYINKQLDIMIKQQQASDKESKNSFAIRKNSKLTKSDIYDLVDVYRKNNYAEIDKDYSIDILIKLSNMKVSFYHECFSQRVLFNYLKAGNHEKKLK